MTNYMTSTQVKDAISKATEGLSPDMANYLTKAETVSKIQSVVNSAIAESKPDLSSYQTSTQVNSAINSAINNLNMSNYYTKGQTLSQINSKISENEQTFIHQQLSINTNVFTGSAYITKQGRLITIQYSGMDVNNNYTTFASLPSWAYPMNEVNSTVFTMDQNYHNYGTGAVNIATSGNVTVQSALTYGYVQFTVTYVTSY